MTTSTIKNYAMHACSYACLALSALLTTSMVQAATSTEQQIGDLQQRVTQLEDKLKEPDSVVHLAGYGSAGYSSRSSGNTFNVFSFSPIFHY